MSFATSSAGHAKAFITGRALTGARTFPVPVYIATVFIVFFLIAAIAPKLLQTHDPLELGLMSPLKAPSLAHWLGTDQSAFPISP